MNVYSKFKRFIDIIFSIFLLAFLSPFVILMLIVIFFDLKASPVFYQKRAGLYGKEFNLIKLKTMKDLRDGNGQLLPDEKRITKVGHFIRKYSLDEIPQLINILKGNMSFIGPRPFIYEYMNVYSENEKRRHNVRPGISGWAQVNGRNTISWKEKFKLDLYYVENISIYLDIKILFLTIYKIFKTKDVNQDENITMEKYNGQN